MSSLASMFPLRGANRMKRTWIGIGNEGLASGDVVLDGRASAVPCCFDETQAVAEDLFDGTVAASPLDAGVPTASSFGRRSTVLPRVEIVGAEPRLVLDEQARYETVRHLGSGGLGEVVGARDNDIGREVAVKRIRSGAKSAPLLARFVEEVRTIGSLEHPNIVPIHDVGQDENGDYYFVMKCVDGETLEAVIERLSAGDRETHARYGFERRVEIFRALLEAVAFAHSKGIVHRDIKPANVMVGAYGEVMLMDWGIAKRLRETGAPLPAQPIEPRGPSRRGPLFETRAGEIVGTPAYMSPEQSRGDLVDERSDIYSLSILFYEFLTLTHPLDGKRTLGEMIRAIGVENPTMAGAVQSPHQPSTPMDLSWFVQEGYRKDPADRYASVREMKDRLDRRADGIIPIQCHVTLLMRAANGWIRLLERRPVLVTLLMLVALVLAAAFGLGGAARVRG
jgi:serine/threonine protein kinase